MIVKIKVSDCKSGDYIHLKPVEGSPIWIRGHYDRFSKTYSLISYDDANREIFRKGSSFVYIEQY